MTDFTIKKHIEIPHTESTTSVNTIQTKPFDNQKIENMSNNTTQTAVDWLVKEYHLPTDSPLVIQAKMMEKEQHKRSYGESLMSKYQTFEHYWNEIYGDNK